MGCAASTESNLDSNATIAILSLNKIYQRLQLIGSGTYGKVYRCLNKMNNQEYALKVVQITAKNKDEAIKQINNLKQEISVLKKLNHPNIIKYYSFDISSDNNQVEIVLEYAKEGSLKDYINKHGVLGQIEASKKVRQILEGLKYLHSQSIVHRDLKCANILVMVDGTLKISDFGTAKYIKIKNNDDIAKFCSSLKGTPYYMAPQVLKRSGHNTSADIWSLGCLLIEILSGKAPWTSLTNKFQQIISYIISGIHPPFPPNLTEECECFLESCLDNVPTQRLTSQQLLKHRFIDSNGISRKNSTVPLKKYNETVKTKYSRNQYDIEDDVEPNEKEIKEKYKGSMQDRTKTKAKRYEQINEYIEEKGRNRKRKERGPRQSGKSKKQRVGSVKISDSNKLIDENDEIETISHFQNDAVVRNLFNTKTKKQQMLKINKTTPQVKLPQSILEDLKQIEQNTVQVEQLYVGKTAIKIQSIETNLRTKTESAKEDVINTVISREERNRYLENQKVLRDQRQQEKRKWQRQLKQGAEFLRKQITSRYIL